MGFANNNNIKNDLYSPFLYVASMQIQIAAVHLGCHIHFQKCFIYKEARKALLPDKYFVFPDQVDGD